MIPMMPAWLPVCQCSGGAGTRCHMQQRPAPLADSAGIISPAPHPSDVTPVTRVPACDCVRLQRYNCELGYSDLILGRDMNCNSISCAEYIKILWTPRHIAQCPPHQGSSFWVTTFKYPDGARSKWNGVISLCWAAPLAAKEAWTQAQRFASWLVMAHVRVLLHEVTTCRK